MGTPNYMAPEQIEHPGEVDHRADIYALGVVFYQMLTGELPGKPIEPPSKKVQIDVRLDEVVLRALEKKPELRYQQVSEVKSAVETITGRREDKAPAQAEAPSTADQIVPEAKAVRTRLRLASAALFIAGCLCLGGFALLNSLINVLPIGSARATMAFIQSLQSGFPGGLARLKLLTGLGLANLGPLAGVLALACAWQVRRLEGFALAVTASVLSVLVAVWLLPLGILLSLGMLPLGLTALVILCQKKVRAAFRAQRELAAGRGLNAIDARAGYKLAVTSAVLVLLSVAVAPIYAVIAPGPYWVSGPAELVVAVVFWLQFSASRASVMLGWLALWAMRRSTARARGLGYAVLGVSFAPVLEVFRFFHPAGGPFWIQREGETSQIPANMLLALLAAGLLAWGLCAWKSRLAGSGAKASGFMRRLCSGTGIVVLAYAGDPRPRNPGDAGCDMAPERGYHWFLLEPPACPAATRQQPRKLRRSHALGHTGSPGGGRPRAAGLDLLASRWHALVPAAPACHAAWGFAARAFPSSP